MFTEFSCPLLIIQIGCIKISIDAQKSMDYQILLFIDPQKSPGDKTNKESCLSFSFFYSIK